MSATFMVYFGSYVKAWLPKESRISEFGNCLHCKRHGLSGKYCPYDGAELAFDTETYMVNSYELIESVFGDGDTFATVDLDADSVAFIANSKDQPGHAVVWADKDIQEIDVPERDFSGDWHTLVEYLSSKSIRYELKFGLLTYYL